MKINKAYKFRLEPTKEQIAMLNQHCGNSRFVWNKFVEYSKAYYLLNNKFPNQCMFQKYLVDLKEQHDFISIAHSQPLQINAQRITHVNEKALQKENIAERNKKIAIAKNDVGAKTPEQNEKALRKAMDYAFPKFKKKYIDQGSLFYPQGFKIGKSRMFFPKLGWINLIKHRIIEGKPLYTTITQDGKHWYVSITCEVNIKEIPKTPLEQLNETNFVGVDLGTNDFANLSDGTVIANPKNLKKYQDKLAKEQRKLARKQLNEKEINGKVVKVSSNNRLKQLIKVQDIYRKIRNLRQNFLHQTTSGIIAKYHGISLETLDIQGMMQKNTKKNGGNAYNRSIADASWCEFCRQLEYKSKWFGKWFFKIDQYEASSKTCSSCGNVIDMPVEQRTFHCSNKSCNLIMDRDLNAAINIRNIALRELKKIGESTGGTSGFEACGSLKAKPKKLSKLRRQKQEKFGLLQKA